MTRFDRYKRWVLDHRILGPVTFGGLVLSVLLSFVLLVFPDARSWIQYSSFVNESISIVDDAIDVAIEEHPDEEERLEKVSALYKDFANGSFKASDYFSAQVDTYYTVHNLTPEKIDSFFALNTQSFKEPRTTIQGSTFSFSNTREGHRAITFWSDFTCFRNDKQKKESCSVLVEIIFDRSNNIVSLAELKVENLRYTVEY